ncbi:AAA family ATPase [Pirellulaceae bacterium SH501]
MEGLKDRRDCGEAARDLAERLGLYNREHQLEQLLEGFGNACDGQAEIVILPGVSGSGKTSLANAIRSPAKKANCLVLDGKFNQFDLDVPYVALRQLLQQLCVTIRKANHVEKVVWIEQIREAVHDHGALLIHLVPEFAPLLGNQPPLEPIGPLEARHRFASLIQSVLTVVCRPESPLVLFIDDCQWADPASLQLLSSLAIGTDLKYLLLIAAYREEETDANHPFIALVRDWERQSLSVRHCELTGLSLDGIQKMLPERVLTTDCPKEALAQAVLTRSGGNALFATQLVHLVSQSWRPKEFMSEVSTGTSKDVPSLPVDILGIFTQQIQQLGREFQSLLSTASCLGHCFELAILACCSDRSEEECERLLLPGIPDLLVPFEKQGQLHSPTPGGSKRWFRFRHDRVQQAANRFIPADQLPRTRLRLVERMLQKFSERERMEFACDLAEHVNAGSHLLQDERDVFRCVALNQAAADSAMTATAYRSALRYHRAARRCLRDSMLKEVFWLKHHELAFRLYLNHAETEYLEGDIHEAERCVHVAVTRAASSKEKADAMVVSVVHYTMRGMYVEAIEVGRQALRELGVSLPEESDLSTREEAIASIPKLLSESAIQSDQYSPIDLDPVLASTARVFIALGPPCYRARQSLWGWIVPMVVKTILRHGPMPELAYCFPAMSGLLMYRGYSTEDARRFMDLTDHWIANANPSYSDRSVAHLMLGSSARHWFHPMKKCSEDYRKAVEMGKQSGNLQYATYALAHDLYCTFFSGRPLDEISSDSEVALEFSRKRQNRWAIDLLQGGMRVVNELKGSQNEGEHEEGFLSDLESRGNRQVSVIYHVMQSQAKMFMGDMDGAWLHCERAHCDLPAIATQGLLPWPEHLHTRLLLQIIRENDAPPSTRENSVFDTDAENAFILSKLEQWSEQSPSNYLHKLYLVQAELARRSRDYPQAAWLYDRAIEEATKAGCYQWESFANERAAEFWRSLGNFVLVAVYWRYAFQGYQQWGAHSKLAAMTDSFRALIGASLERTASAQEVPCVASEEKCRRIIDRHAQLLSIETKRLAEQKASEHATRVVEELTSAADSLRRDLAANREVATLLQKQRDRERAYNEELEQRVRLRTQELEIVAKKLEASNAILERRNEELDQFAYIASHDLKAPLHGIGLVSAWLKEDCGNILPPSSKRYLEDLEQRVQRMGKLLDSILSYSRAGRNLEAEEPVQVQELMDQILESLHLPEGFQVQLQKPMPVLTTNPNGLHQVFQNLIQNAVKHHHRENGTISIAWRETDELFEFTVSDDGPGIDLRYHTKIFQMFQTLRPRDEVEGSGIGLSIAKRVVELHGGQISIESEVGQGTSFRFTWPKRND